MSSEHTLKVFKWINLLTLIGVVIINALSNSLPFNNLTTGQLSERVNVLFTPAGYVFSIWSVIYILLAIWVIRPFFSIKKGDVQAYHSVGYAFLVNGILNSSWLFLFHYEFYITTMFVMAALLINLIVIYRRVFAVSGTTIWMRLPFSVYIGWVSVATIVNTGIFFNALGFEDGLLFSPQTWTNTLLIVAVGLAVWFIWSQGETVFPLVFVWAFTGIAVERWNEYPSIAVFALSAAVVLLLITIIQIYKFRGFYKIRD
ncbi:TspO/MBR family protein [Salipaludibacillus aurantiacus]|uniref:TspO/MBR family protein n=1 Tax=Salipaludibacillus aurantiacus TaxID=1601833 RepID=A0A1H9SHK0_9BACI|nr:TspO/MBR family protein [Salipaludibacillus aurantiacus]SER84095.1 TspO/MBR family protein [Salipaludibacillus aurantiacus]